MGQALVEVRSTYPLKPLSVDISGPKTTSLLACAEFTLAGLIPRAKLFGFFEKVYPLPKVCNLHLLVLGFQAKIALVASPNDSCDQEHGVSAGVHSSVEFYKSRVDRFMCNGSCYTTNGFPLTFGLFRADNETKLKE